MGVRGPQADGRRRVSRVTFPSSILSSRASPRYTGATLRPTRSRARGSGSDSRRSDPTRGPTASWPTDGGDGGVGGGADRRREGGRGPGDAPRRRTWRPRPARSDGRPLAPVTARSRGPRLTADQPVGRARHCEALRRPRPAAPPPCPAPTRVTRPAPARAQPRPRGPRAPAPRADPSRRRTPAPSLHGAPLSRPQGPRAWLTGESADPRGLTTGFRRKIPTRRGKEPASRTRDKDKVSVLGFPTGRRKPSHHLSLGGPSPSEGERK